ncbi:MAG: hypothetical protein ACRCSK_07270 [Fusobacteriaceae bacterium]
MKELLNVYSGNHQKNTYKKFKKEIEAVANEILNFDKYNKKGS